MKFADLDGVKDSFNHDIKVCVHTYDGCGRACAGCVVDLHLKKNVRGMCLIGKEDRELVHSRVVEYYDWVRERFGAKRAAGIDAPKIDHFSYTMRFGDHSELDVEELEEICDSFRSEHRTFSTAPGERYHKFKELKKRVPGRHYLELVYDGGMDDAKFVGELIGDLKDNGVAAIPELLMTRRFLRKFSAKDFAEQCLPHFEGRTRHMTLVRYSPSASRRFGTAQVVPVDDEVEWLAEVAERAKDMGLSVILHPIDEHAKRLSEWKKNGLLETETPAAELMETIRDSLLTSIYIDSKLDLYIWSESIGNHCLDGNLNFEPLGNLRDGPIHNFVAGKGNKLNKMLTEIVSGMIRHPKCSPCIYKRHCAIHAVYLFRRWIPDDGRHCYGYIPVVRKYAPELPAI